MRLSLMQRMLPYLGVAFGITWALLIASIWVYVIFFEEPSKPGDTYSPPSTGYQQPYVPPPPPPPQFDHNPLVPGPQG